MGKGGGRGTGKIPENHFFCKEQKGCFPELLPDFHWPRLTCPTEGSIL